VIKILSVGAGGFAGAILRYLACFYTDRMAEDAIIPYGTLLVNILGCLLIGLGWGIVNARDILSPEIRLFLFTGVLGGFTTYSTFGYESFLLAQKGNFILPVLNITIHIFAGISAVWAGHLLGEMV
jgi:CrcB protein